MHECFSKLTRTVGGLHAFERRRVHICGAIASKEISMRLLTLSVAFVAALPSLAQSVSAPAAKSASTPLSATNAETNYGYFELTYRLPRKLRDAGPWS